MKKLIIFILICVMCGFVFNKSIIKANTQVNNTLGYDSSFLYNETNTYQYDRKIEQKNYIDNNGNNGTENVVTQLYDMSNKNSNTVSNDDPLLTVITHGLGGDASHWSLNDDKFTYCDDSIVKRLNNIVNGGVNVYWYIVEQTKELKIYDVTDNLTVTNDTDLLITNTTNLTKIENITDIIGCV